MEDKRLIQESRNIFTSLKTDPNCVLLSEEKIGERLLKKFKKSKYAKHYILLKLINLVDIKLDNEGKLHTRVDYVAKKEIGRSTLYSFDGAFQLIHADVGNLEFLGKNATVSRYVLLVVDLRSSKVYIYPMRSRKQILQIIKIFYDEVKSKKK